MSITYLLVKRIDNLVTNEKKRGYRGICIQMEEECKESPFPLEVVDILKTKYRNVHYYGDEKYLPNDCKLYHNRNNAYVGKLLAFEW